MDGDTIQFALGVFITWVVFATLILVAAKRDK